MTDTHRTPFLNCHIDNVDLEEVFSVIADHVRSRIPGFMVSLNTDIAIRLESDKEFKAVYDAADLALIDSQPLVRLARWRKINVKQKLSGSDLMPLVCERAAREGWTCYFLGGDEGVPEQAARNLKERYAGLGIAGTLSPAYGFERDEKAVAAVMDAVRDAHPDIMFICLGSPKSEKFIHPRLSDLGVPFTLSVGAAIDFCAGNKRRAPAWMQRHSLEWLHRFSQEPKRLFKRYFIDSWKLIAIIWRTRRCSPCTSPSI